MQIDHGMDQENNLCIETKRFWLRPLAEADASDRYLAWLSADNSQFIQSAGQMKAINDLSDFIRAKIADIEVLFLGIFEKHSNLHIGNIKYEPVDSVARVAVLGILIGDKDFRGLGVASEVIISSARYLRDQKNIEQIVLGVDRNNVQALRAYEKIGFRSEENNFLEFADDCYLPMGWTIR